MKGTTELWGTTRRGKKGRCGVRGKEKNAPGEQGGELLVPVLKSIR